MPVPDPQAGQAFVWLITCFLFLSIAVGGGCLLAYTFLPYPPSWLSYVGIAFVCLPWLFWFITVFYRLVSRSFGFRMVIGSGGGNNNASNAAEKAMPDDDDDDVEPGGRNVESPQGTTPREAAVLGDQNGGHHEGKKSKKRTSTSSNSSAASHESELPLANSMGV